MHRGNCCEVVNSMLKSIRTCDLESAFIETKADLSAGRFIRATAEQHLARLKAVEIDSGDISANCTVRPEKPENKA